MAAVVDRQRADARRSRAAILGAARELLGERSSDVPMYEIAQRAGVGQGTLYRHFATYGDLAAALYGESLDELERLAAAERDDPDLFTRLFRTAVGTQAGLHGLVGYLRAHAEGAPHLRTLMARGTAILAGPLADGVRRGTLRPDLTTEDVMTILAMVEGVLDGIDGPAARRAALDRAMRLLWRMVLPDPAQ
jgi:AcrR family transcriptional regulator